MCMYVYLYKSLSLWYIYHKQRGPLVQDQEVPAQTGTRNLSLRLMLRFWSTLGR